jgi:N-acetylglutamate synthase-like GNAT family acetyltransferase
MGRRLYDALSVRALARGVERAYLLTMSIEPLAERWGFRRIGRGEVPAVIRETSQFREACCASAVAMSLDIRAAVKVGCT